MESFPSDTTLEAARVQMAIFRQMEPARRLQLALGMSDSLRQMVASGVRSRHPGYTEKQVAMAVFRLTLGDELFQEAYPGTDIGI